MRTFCPHCQTTFRITPEQLKARAGKVRCGQCQTVFNALDCLLDDENSAASVTTVANVATATPAAPATPLTPVSAAPASPAPPKLPADTTQSGIELARSPLFAEDQNPTLSPSSLEDDAGLREEQRGAETFSAYGPAEADHVTEEMEETAAAVIADLPGKREPFFVETDPPPATDTADLDRESDPFDAPPATTPSQAKKPVRPLRTIKDNDGLIMPRATNEIEGYSRWAEDPISAPIDLPEERPTRWPFVLAAVLLIVVLAGQVAFHFRSEIVVSAPSLRPMLLLFSQSLGADLPLPRHVELVSIEASDLQTDPSRNNLLMLTATLHNRARYAQAYPSLELSLTDTGDTAIVRRVFSPTEYLPPATAADQPFAAGTDVSVRLWLEANKVSAAGYRVYVFYP